MSVEAYAPSPDEESEVDRILALVEERSEDGVSSIATAATLKIPFQRVSRLMEQLHKEERLEFRIKKGHGYYFPAESSEPAAPEQDPAPAPAAVAPEALERAKRPMIKLPAKEVTDPLACGICAQDGREFIAKTESGLKVHLSRTHGIRSEHPEAVHARAVAEAKAQREASGEPDPRGTQCRHCGDDRGSFKSRVAHERFCGKNPERELTPVEKRRLSIEEGERRPCPVDGCDTAVLVSKKGNALRSHLYQVHSSLSPREVSELVRAWAGEVEASITEPKEPLPSLPVESEPAEGGRIKCPIDDCLREFSRTPLLRARLRAHLLSHGLPLVEVQARIEQLLGPTAVYTEIPTEPEASELTIEQEARQVDLVEEELHRIGRPNVEASPLVAEASVDEPPELGEMPELGELPDLAAPGCDGDACTIGTLPSPAPEPREHPAGNVYDPVPVTEVTVNATERPEAYDTELGRLCRLALELEALADRHGYRVDVELDTRCETPLTIYIARPGASS